MKTLAAVLLVSAALVAPAAAQAMKGDYLDYYIVQVKPDKRADFDAAIKKIVDANRKNNGDKWLAYEVAYGENNTVYFVSTRPDIGSIDTASEAFMKAMKAAYGQGFESVFHDVDACLTGARSELRRRRWDMSSLQGGDDGYAKYVGAAKWIRATTMRVRPGHTAEYEEMVAMLKEAAEKADPTGVRLISQAVAGAPAGTYYMATLQPNLGAFDSKTPTAKELLGEEGYEKYLKVVAESVISSETIIGKLRPDLSNPPEEVVNVTRDFWSPKPDTMTAARAKQTAGKKNEPK